MRRAEELGGIVVEVSRFGMETKEVRLPEDASVRDALTRAGITTVGATEKIWVNGQAATMEDILDDGDSIQLVGKKEGGLK